MLGQVSIERFECYRVTLAAMANPIKAAKQDKNAAVAQYVRVDLLLEQIAHKEGEVRGDDLRLVEAVGETGGFLGGRVGLGGMRDRAA